MWWRWSGIEPAQSIDRRLKSTVYFKLYKSDHIKKNVTTEGSCIKHHLSNQYLKYLFQALISRRIATGNKQLLA